MRWCCGDCVTCQTEGHQSRRCCELHLDECIKSTDRKNGRKFMSSLDSQRVCGSLRLPRQKEREVQVLEPDESPDATIQFACYEENERREQ
jgi:hypothetical protein